VSPARQQATAKEQDSPLIGVGCQQNDGQKVATAQKIGRSLLAIIPLFLSPAIYVAGKAGFVWERNIENAKIIPLFRYLVQSKRHSSQNHSKIEFSELFL
jgi:hypothetical protein